MTFRNLAPLKYRRCGLAYPALRRRLNRGSPTRTRRTSGRSGTTGTAIGDDGGTNQIGMAPGAQWIGCRNMDQGTGTPARYIECMQWFLAPTQIGGGNPDPTKAP